MNTQGQWREYLCDDYLSSSLAQNGYWDEDCQIWYIEPLARVEENVEEEFLQVGRPGVDGIGFGYRRGQPGFWAWYPMERRYEYLTPTIQDFLNGWTSGEITV